MFYQVGCLTKQEFKTLTGINPADPAAKNQVQTAKIQGEDGKWKEYILVSLSGMDLSELASMRKMEVSHFVDVRLDEQILSSEMQITKGQMQLWYDFSSGDHVSKHRPQNRTATNDKPVSLYSISAWREMAEELESERAAAEIAALPAPSSDGLAELDMEQASGPVHQQVESVQDMLGGPTADANKKASKKAAKRKRDKDKEEDDMLLEDRVFQSGTGSLALGGITELARLDPDMAVVARRHEELTKRGLAPCFANLEMGYVFQKGGKIGQAKKGVPELHIRI